MILDVGLWTLDVGRSILDVGLWALDVGRSILDVGLFTGGGGRRRRRWRRRRKNSPAQPDPSPIGHRDEISREATPSLPSPFPPHPSRRPWARGPGPGPMYLHFTSLDFIFKRVAAAATRWQSPILESCISTSWSLYI